MKPYYEDGLMQIYCGDCRSILPELSKASAIVCDPPYELGFMGKSWDSKGVSFQSETWRVIRDACKSGSPLMAFGGTRTFHRIAVAIEDAGWEIRDTLMWVYGSGFPKSLNIGKATESPLWEGYGTALKPAWEPVILAMNPLDGTFAHNALEHGIAGLNIDGCRVEGEKGNGVWGTSNATIDKDRKFNASPDMAEYRSQQHPKGRFPANLIHDGSQMVMELFPNTKSSGNRTGQIVDSPARSWKNTSTEGIAHIDYNDNGSAARFFYCAKASKAERNRGCEELEASRVFSLNAGGRDKKGADGDWDDVTSRWISQPKQNNHPTVKPLALMEYLIKLVTYPEYNLIIDPFCGSGTTLLACKQAGIPCIGIDSDEHSCEIAKHRVMNMEGI